MGWVGNVGFRGRNRVVAEHLFVGAKAPTPTEDTRLKASYYLQGQSRWRPCSSQASERVQWVAQGYQREERPTV
jgi:hypothetical protein